MTQTTNHDVYLWSKKEQDRHVLNLENYLPQTTIDICEELGMRMHCENTHIH